MNLQTFRRIINRTVWAYDEPNANSKRLKLYWHDLVVPITNTTVSEMKRVHNRVWYQLEVGVAMRTGWHPACPHDPQPAAAIPTRARWGSQCPVCGCLCRAGCEREFVYRLYYETVHWVASVWTQRMEVSGTACWTTNWSSITTSLQNTSASFRPAS